MRLALRGALIVDAVSLRQAIAAFAKIDQHRSTLE
jgi:hypothetical protein